MGYGKLATWDNETNKWDTVEETAPMPVAVLETVAVVVSGTVPVSVGPVTVIAEGTALSPDAVTLTDTYAAVAGTSFDTLATSNKCIGYQVAVADEDADVKMVASFDGASWLDLISEDENGVNHNDGGMTPVDQAEVVVAAAATAYLMLPGDDGRSAFRHFALFAKNKTPGDDATVTVLAFSK